MNGDHEVAVDEAVTVHVDHVLSWTGDDAEVAVWLAANGFDPETLEVPSQVAVRAGRVRIEPGPHWPVRRDDGWTPLVVPLPDPLIARADVVVLATGPDDEQGRHYGAARRLTARSAQFDGGAPIDYARDWVVAKVREQLAST